MRALLSSLFLFWLCGHVPAGAQDADAGRGLLRICTVEFADSAVARGRAVIAEAYGALGLEFKLIRVPAERSLQLVSRGFCDAELGRTRAIERRHPDLVRVPVPLLHLTTVALSVDPRVQIKSRADLRHYHVGAIIGNPQAVEIVPKGTRITLVATPRQLLRLLRSGRIDVAVAIESLLDQEGLQNGASDINAVPVRTAPFYHYLSPRRRDLLPQLTEIFRKITREEPQR